ncbi:hypothetical protein ENUP19_0041G0092 [Entamoeba nuttalli]|uniref:MRH domain-containing protein n=2 Tax=Entamoeba nuttalli TaxID=412467 RepID=K2H7E2_ENTNP|nr:hypothetical protein ENU1_165860 [Entamoeba nuttalli P19]EKE38444.1 hypothetical protein ENU1_165860 [Entamoeba nuttalli P19]|eukprot:XP_008859222.1 hypothetical protein ENU1_165860 [Entamoeba nuttalli P19]
MLFLLFVSIVCAVKIPKCSIDGNSIYSYIPYSKVTASSGDNQYVVQICSSLPEFDNGINGVAKIENVYYYIANVETQKISTDVLKKTITYQYTGESCGKENFKTTVVTRCGQTQAAVVTQPDHCTINFDVITPAMCKFDPKTVVTNKFLVILRYLFAFIVIGVIVGAIFNYFKTKQLSTEIIPFYSLWATIFGGFSDIILILINNGRASVPRF